MPIGLRGSAGNRPSRLKEIHCEKKGDKLEVGFKADTLKALTRRACSIQKLLTERSILKKSGAPWLLRVSGAKLWADNKPEEA
jgi:hypothetical protein